MNIKKNLEKAFKKLKSSTYFDKTQLVTRDMLVDFESNNNIVSPLSRHDFKKHHDTLGYNHATKCTPYTSLGY